MPRALVTGAVTYVLVHFDVIDIGLSPILVSLPASALAMLAGGTLGSQDSAEMLDQIEVELCDRSIAETGENVVVTMAMPVGAGKSTNMLKIHELR